MNEIESIFKLKSNFVNFFGGDPHSDFQEKLNNLKSELEKLDAKAFEKVSFDIHSLTKMKKWQKYDYKEGDSNHPKRIVDKLSLVETHITENKLFELLDKINKLDSVLKAKVGEALKVIIPIYEKSLEIQTLAGKFLELDPVIIPDHHSDSRSQKAKKKEIKKEIKNAMKKNDSFWREIRLSLESDIDIVRKTLKEIQKKV